MITYTVSLNIQGEGNHSCSMYCIAAVRTWRTGTSIFCPQRILENYYTFRQTFQNNIREGEVYFGILSYVRVSGAIIHLRDLCIHYIFVNRIFFCCCHMSRVSQNWNILGLDRLSYCIYPILTHSYYNIIKSIYLIGFLK